MMVDTDVVTVIFSCDRSLQLFALLQSLDRNCLDVRSSKVIILYRCNNKRSKLAYEAVKSEFNWVTFIEETNFTKDLQKAIENKKYILFLVDDCIITRRFSLIRAIQLIEGMSFVIGYSLRLGKNIEYCYPLNRKMIKPEFYSAGGGDSLMFNWTMEQDDYGYPGEVSSSLYRIKDIEPVLKMENIKNPNYLEWYLSQYVETLRNQKPFLLCPVQSVAFCNPLNKVNVSNNRAGNKSEYSIDSLLDVFESGKRIDYKKFLDYNNVGCHEEVDLTYV